MRRNPDEEPPHPDDRFHTAGIDLTQRAVGETIDLLKDNWQAVEHVADALQKRDRLTQTELDHIIAHGQRK